MPTEPETVAVPVETLSPTDDGWRDLTYTQKAMAYHASVSDTENGDMFSLGYQWADKKHRHVYNLCNLLCQADAEITALRAALAGAAGKAEGEEC